MLTHLFGNPAIRLRYQLRRTRGFATPDYSGFARSENVLNVGQIYQQRVLRF
jgi:hypothetical protein